MDIAMLGDTRISDERTRKYKQVEISERRNCKSKNRVSIIPVVVGGSRNSNTHVREIC